MAASFTCPFLLPARCVYPGATLLHCDRIHAIWEPTRLFTGMQPGGSECCCVTLYGHSDLLCYGVPGEEELHSQVGEITLSWYNLRL